MGALGLGLFFFGYWVAFYGWDQLQGGNNSFLSLGVPGQFKNAPTDKQGGTANANAQANSAASQTLQSIQAGQSAALSAQPGTGVATTGGVTVVYGAQGQKTCLDKSGKVVACPPGV